MRTEDTEERHYKPETTILGRRMVTRQQDGSVMTAYVYGRGDTGELLGATNNGVSSIGSDPAEAKHYYFLTNNWAKTFTERFIKEQFYPGMEVDILFTEDVDQYINLVPGNDKRM